MTDEKAPLVFVMGRRGRPPKFAAPLSERLVIHVTPDQKQVLLQVAHEARQPLAEVVRDAVNEYAGDYMERKIFKE